MDCRGLVDPKNKPFGRLLPLEVQVKIMFWVHCFYPMDQRKNVVRELKGLPKCDLTGFPLTSGRGPMVEPSGGSFACAPEKWLSPLPPPHGSPVIGKGKSVFFFVVLG